MFHQRRILFPILILLCLHLHPTTAARDQFQKWYPEWRFAFSTILRENCTKQYDWYLHGSKNISTIDNVGGGDPTNQLVQPVVKCILDATSSFIQSGMASAQVLLGLMPSMLATLGPSVEETSLLLVIGRRPFLALCIAAGSPALFPMRSFANKDPVRLLKDRKGRLRAPPLARAGLFVALEYLVVFAAVANIAELTRELGLQVVCNFAPQRTYLVWLWAFAPLVIHGCGSIALRLRAHRRRCEQSPNTLLYRVKRQFTPFNKQAAFHVNEVNETYSFTFVSWFTAMLSVCHTIYGTLVFSSMLFISVRDSVMVISRFFISVMCCRVILMYELAALRDRYSVNTVYGSDVELPRCLRPAPFEAPFEAPPLHLRTQKADILLAFLDEGMPANVHGSS